MTTDMTTMLWKEWKELLLSSGDRRGALLMLVLPVIVVGVVIPWQAGRSWIESPTTMVVWAWFPLFLVINVIADSFAGERERHTLETLLASRLSDFAILFGKIAAAVLYAWGLTLLMLLFGLVTVNVTAGTGELLLYPLETLLGAAGLSLLGAILTAGAGVLVSLRASTARAAQQRLGLAVMVLFVVPFLGVQALPRELIASTFGWAAENPAASVLILSGVLLAIDVLLVAAAAARFKRSALVID
jgi:ABC-2 type transport system permease protein